MTPITFWVKGSTMERGRGKDTNKSGFWNNLELLSDDGKKMGGGEGEIGE